MKPYPVKFIPIPKERIWGGDRLKSWFNVEHKASIGEYWVLSGHPDGLSIVKNGPLKGVSLVSLVEKFPEEYLGDSPQDRFPLLIKFIEAKDDLSVQIHPDDEYALNVEGDFGKTEAWYFLDTKKDSKIVYGHLFKSKEEYKKAIKNQKVKDYLRYQDVDKGQLVYVPSRTLHALLAGTVVIEIQQTSDITYRVYDWDRIDKNGKRRELHIDKAADVMVYGDTSNYKDCSTNCFTLFETNDISHKHLLTCDYFSIEKLSINKSCYLVDSNKANPDVLVIIDGKGSLECKGSSTIKLSRGECILIPSSIKNYQIKTDKFIKILRSYY